MDAPPRRRRPSPPGGTVRRAPKSADQRELDAFLDRAAWRRLRRAYLSANPLCGRCAAEGRRGVPASVVHHVVDRAERPDLSLDWDNLTGLCKPHHDSETARRQNATGRDS